MLGGGECILYVIFYMRVANTIYAQPLRHYFFGKTRLMGIPVRVRTRTEMAFWPWDASKPEHPIHALAESVHAPD